MMWHINHALIILGLFTFVTTLFYSKGENPVPVEYANEEIDVEKELYVFFQQLTNNKDFIARGVYVDGNETSMEKYSFICQPQENLTNR